MIIMMITKQNTCITLTVSTLQNLLIYSIDVHWRLHMANILAICCGESEEQ